MPYDRLVAAEEADGNVDSGPSHLFPWPVPSACSTYAGFGPCANPAMLRLNVLVSSAERRRQQLLEWQERRKAAGGGVRAEGSAKTKSRESMLLGYSGSGAGGCVGRVIAPLVQSPCCAGVECPGSYMPSRETAPEPSRCV